MRTEDYQLARVDLIPRAPNFSEDQFRGLFKDEMKTQRPGMPQPTPPQPAQPDRRTPEKAPITETPGDAPPESPATRPSTQPAKVEPATRPATRPALPSIDPRLFPTLERFDLADIRHRISLLQIGLDVDFQTVSPDGKWCAFVGSTDGKQNIYAYPLDSTSGSSVRQLTSTTGGKGWVRFSPNSGEIYYLENGQIRACRWIPGLFARLLCRRRWRSTLHRRRCRSPARRGSF